MLLVRSDVSAGNSLSIPQLMAVCCHYPVFLYTFEFAVSEINWFDLIWKWDIFNVVQSLVIANARTYMYLHAKWVTGTDTGRSVTYDFLLVIRSNHGHISYRFRYKRRFQSKSQFFSIPMSLTPPVENSPWNFFRVVGLKKTRVMPISDGGKSWTMCICFDTTPACDGRTDGQICHRLNDIALWIYRHAVAQ